MIATGADGPERSSARRWQGRLSLRAKVDEDGHQQWSATAERGSGKVTVGSGTIPIRASLDVLRTFGSRLAQ